MSITLELSDFAMRLVASSPKSLGSFTTVSTTVVGEGKANWLIEDFNGVTRQLPTTSYHASDATIRLFSPQVYIDESTTNSSLFLNSTGIALTLTCGTILCFSLQARSNLPTIFTQKALQKLKSTCTRHVPTTNPIL